MPPHPDFRAPQELRDEVAVGELPGALHQRPDAAPDPQRGAGGAAGLQRPRAAADDTAGDQEVGHKLIISPGQLLLVTEIYSFLN